MSRMRKIYISTLSFFENIREKPKRLIIFSPVKGVTHIYSVCYENGDDMYCIIVNDEQMMLFIVDKATELMKQKPNNDGSIGEPVELVISKKRRPKKLYNFWK